MDMTTLLNVVKEKCPKVLFWRITQEKINVIDGNIKSAGKLNHIVGTFQIHQVSVNIQNAANVNIDYRTLRICHSGETSIHYSLNKPKKDNSMRTSK